MSAQDPVEAATEKFVKDLSSAIRTTRVWDRRGALGEQREEVEARRQSLAQEITEGLRVRGHWAPTTASSDVIMAVFKALDMLRASLEEKEREIATVRSLFDRYRTDCESSHTDERAEVESRDRRIKELEAALGRAMQPFLEARAALSPAPSAGEPKPACPVCGEPVKYPICAVHRYGDHKSDLMSEPAPSAGEPRHACPQRNSPYTFCACHGTSKDAQGCARCAWPPLPPSTREEPCACHCVYGTQEGWHEPLCPNAPASSEATPEFDMLGYLKKRMVEKVPKKKCECLWYESGTCIAEWCRCDTHHPRSVPGHGGK
jgi:hypothetical protein